MVPTGLAARADDDAEPMPEGASPGVPPRSEEYGGGLPDRLV
ncbi:hypothetical protein [Streptomyces sp. NPDC088739]